MGGLYVKLDADFSLDPKVIDLSESAELMYVRGLQVAKRLLTDGILKTNHMQYVCHRDSLSRSAEVAAELVAAGLWVEIPGGWQIEAWLRRNRPAIEVKRISAARQEAGAKGQAALRANLSQQSGYFAGQVAGQNGKQSAGQVAGQEVEQNLSVCPVSVSVPGSKAVTAVLQPRARVELPGNGSVDPDDDLPPWEPDDPAYKLDPKYTGEAELALWDQKVGKVQPRFRLDSLVVLVRLHQHCKRSIPEIRCLIEHVGDDPDARRFWGTTPALWLRTRDGGEPTWCKVRKHWLDAGGSLPMAEPWWKSVPMPERDPTCECGGGGYTRTNGYKRPCEKCKRGQYLLAGGRIHE